MTSQRRMSADYSDSSAGGAGRVWMVGCFPSGSGQACTSSMPTAVTMARAVAGISCSASRAKEEPEINLIPFIDVLLVILIFLMLTTTYSKFTQLQLTLPVADAEQMRDRPKEVIVSVAADGRYAVNKAALDGRSVEVVAAALRTAASAGPESIVIISADATAPHQSVITVMEAARRAGLTQITFATQAMTPANSPITWPMAW